MVGKVALWELKIILILNILILDFQVNFSMRKNKLEKLKQGRIKNILVLKSIDEKSFNN